MPDDTFFFFLQELYRVCKSGAKVLCILPHPSHDIFLNDPTHVRAVMPGTLAMFSKRYVEGAAKAGNVLTPFYKHYGVDFDINTVTYSYDPSVKDDPDLEWKSKHLRNVIYEWRTTLTVIK